MIEIDRHIEILLLDNDCVIVPGLGGFMAHHVEARYEAEEGLFLPPLRTLGFNPQLKMNDSLLAQSYAEAYDISLPEALRRIETEVKELRRHLAEKGRYELNDLGTLSVNAEGNLVFEPCEAGILTPSLYGLSSFEMLPLGVAAGEAVENAGNGGTTEAGVAAEAHHTAATARQTAAEDGEVGFDDDDTIRIKISWIRNAVAVAAALLAFFLVSTPVSNSSQSNTASFTTINGETIMKMLPSDSRPDETKPAAKAMPVATNRLKGDTAVKTGVAAAKEESAAASKDEVAAVASKAEIAAKSKPAAGAYCIVLASHVSKSGANAFVEKLRARGYGDAAVYEHNKIVRVVYGAYQSETEAQNKLRRLGDNEFFQNSWVYKKK